MKTKNAIAVCVAGTAMALAVVVAHGGEAAGGHAVKTSDSAVVTNDNGSVSRTFTECNVTTNGNMVTERRRETRTTTDTEGNVLESSTSEYAQSYTVGTEGAGFLAGGASPAAEEKGASSPESCDSFLGLKFGEVYDGTNLVSDADQPTLLRAEFKPAKTLAGFGDYYVYVTPKSHKIAKVYACAEHEIDPGARWRKHYLIEALEKRYGTWARLCDFWRPIYAFDIGCGRTVKAYLAGASDEYETIIAAYDLKVLAEARDEAEELRIEARRKAAKARESKVSEAADAF
jgi:hypothetical protein